MKFYDKGRSNYLLNKIINMSMQNMKLIVQKIYRSDTLVLHSFKSMLYK